MSRRIRNRGRKIVKSGENKKKKKKKKKN